MKNRLYLPSFTAVVATAAICVCRASAVTNNLRANRNGILSNLSVVEEPEKTGSGPALRLVQEDEAFYKLLAEELASSMEAPEILPTSNPSDSPTGTPTSSPSIASTRSPTTIAVTTLSPTVSPTASPTIAATTRSPTGFPTDFPSELPTPESSLSPTKTVSAGPTTFASGEPTETPTAEPTEIPSMGPSISPTEAPTTMAPSTSPTVAPTPISTLAPTEPPTIASTNKCNLTLDARSALINIFLRVISNPADVELPGSPQMRALDWIIQEDKLQLCPQDKRLIQRYVMAVFYFSTRGDRWTQCSSPPPLTPEDNIDYEVAEANANALCSLQVDGVDSGSNAWLTSGSECTWGGLGCNEDEFIVRIEMEQNGVAGTIPSELVRLQNLKNLVLEEGILTGTIPTELGEIRSLEQIDLNFNLLQGPIPEELYSLSNLRQLDLNDNELTGSIGSGIGDLMRLSFFQIENNLLEGTLPTELGFLNLLEVATMDNNQLSGTMPCEFMNQAGNLQVLTADCLGAPNRPSPPLVICDCCTQCF